MAGVLACCTLRALAVEAQNEDASRWGLQGPPVTAWEVPHFEIEYVTPRMHRWYAPRHLAESYMRPWYGGDRTSYARERYRTLVNAGLEGAAWYDTFGHRIGRGWMVYTWEQEQAKRDGSLIRKGWPYGGFFQNLVIASDESRGTSARLMIGDGIFTVFTPLTFNKTNFNGLRLDWANERHVGSLLLSRPSQPNRADRTNITHLLGGHAEFKAGDAALLGVTYINAHNAQSQVQITYGNPLYGTLTTGQNQPLDKLWVRLRDDSPADGVSGTSLFRYDIVLVDTSGHKVRGREIGFLPRIEGGRTRAGALVADGSETVLLEYDFAALDYQGLRSATLRRAAVELVVADDYRVEMASNLQTDGERRDPQIVFFPVARSPGNVQDNSNSQVLRLDYGLPTANELLGINWDLVEWHGVSFRGEAVVNRQHGMYPSRDTKHLHHFVNSAHAAYAEAAYERYPWNMAGELFSLSDGYSTNYWLVQGNGDIRYQAPVPDLYEFVDDDDDHDGTPEWERPFQHFSREAFPGYDENGDFIYDHNQNRNRIPDYEEPFLRFRSDRPEYLFGLDLNHNGMIDRFENDLLPDYPYKRDHRGFNMYARGHLGPDASLALGHQRVRLISGDGQTHAVYALAAARWSLRGGQLRLFDFAALVRDDIPDDLEQWVQPVGAVGRMQTLVDRLPGDNAWRNALYADWEQAFGWGLRHMHRFKWEGWWQRGDSAVLRSREGRASSGFLGVINKAEWTVPLGLGRVEPRWKSEYRRVRPFHSRAPVAESLEQTLFLLWVQPILAEQVSISYYARHGRQIFDTQLQCGLEWSRFWMLEGRHPEVAEDFMGRTLVIQLTNRVGYAGYQLVTRVGAQWLWRDFDHSEDQRSSMLFMTINAGLKL